MDVRDPAQLILVLIPALWLTTLAWRRSALGQPRWRWWLSLAVRWLLLVTVAGALAGARGVLPRSDRAVVFAVDVSESVAPATRRRLLDWVRQAWEARQEGDRAGLVVFGRRARVELPLGPSLTVRELPLEGLPRDRTALDRALQAAGGLLAGEDLADAEVVLLTDGNGEPEPALRESRALAASGVRVTTVEAPLTPSPREVLIGDVYAPAVVAAGEPFLLRADLIARSGGEAVLHVLRDDGSYHQEAVALAPGSNVKTVSVRLEEPGVHVFQLSLAAEGDGDPANNSGGAIVRVRGRPRLLYAQGSLVGPGGSARSPQQVSEPLRAVLEGAGFEVEVVGPGALPLGLDELAGFDGVILGSLGAEHWTEGQMEALRRYVFDLGGGVLALGGEESFGLGGYYGTPIEALLPLSSDVREKKVLPSLALVFCLDRSGSMLDTVGSLTKLDLAKEGAVRSLELLQPFDHLGVIGFSDEPSWIVPLQQVDQVAPIAKRIRGIEIGGGTELGPALREAHAALAMATAQLRHVVLLTDGRSGEDPLALQQIQAELRQDRITLTTVGVGEEIDQGLLTALAEGTGGRFLWARDPRTVPRLLTKEAVTATRALVVERRVQVRALGAGLELGVPWESAPPLLGFVMTVAKPDAEVLLDTGPDDTLEDGPILARWRYGLGKASAFSSDASARWTAPWLDWPGFTALFSDVMRWTAREPEPPGFKTSLQLEQGEGRVLVEARAPDGAPLNGLQLNGRVSAPAEASEVPTVALEQTGPGRYEGRFETSRPGAYFVSLEQLAGESSQLAGGAGAVLAYPREYRDLSSNTALLEELAAEGRHLTIDHPPDLVFGGPRTVRSGYRPLERWLLLVAGLLLVFDVAARRLVIPEGLRRWRARVGRTPEQRAAEAGVLLSRMQAHKAAGREAAQAKRESDRLAEVAPAPAGGLATAPPQETSATAAATADTAPEPAVPAPRSKPAAPRSKPARAPSSAEPGSAMSKLLEAKRKARDEGRG